MCEGNPQEAARAVVRALVQVVGQPGLTETAKSEVADALAAARDLSAQLGRIGERHVEWASLGATGTAADARTYWESLDAGVLSGDGVVQLMAMSPLLTSLERAGLGPISMCKLGVGDRRFGEAMTERFDRLAPSRQWLQRLPATQQPLTDWATCRLDELGHISSMLRLCVQHHVVRSFEAERQVWNGGEPTWERVTPAEVPHLLRGEGGRRRAGSLARVRARYVDRARCSLLSGGWLVALAASVVDDELNGLGSDHELYTMVQVSSPSEVVSTNLELDVIARAGRDVIVVECASGRLTAADVEAFEQLATKLRSGLTATDAVEDVHFVLVVDPHVTDMGVVGSLSPSICVTSPQELRGAVAAGVGRRRTARRVD